MQITLPPEIESELNELTAAGNYATPADYLRDLVLRDWAARHQPDLEARAQASIDSGPAEPLATDWKEQIVAETRARLDDA